MRLRLPGAGLLALVIVVGAYLVVAGVLQIASAVGEDQPWVGYALGVVNLVLGILILALPGIGIVTFAVLFGIGLVVRGAVALWVGLRLRRLRPAALDRTVADRLLAPSDRSRRDRQHDVLRRRPHRPARAGDAADGRADRVELTPRRTAAPSTSRSTAAVGGRTRKAVRTVTIHPPLA